MKSYWLDCMCLLIIGLVSIGVSAQNGEIERMTPVSGVQADVLVELNDAAEKTIALAEALPDGKYGWRPVKGVRSFSEVFMHVAGANMFFGGLAGIHAEGFEGDAGIQKVQAMEKITDKQKVVEELRKSFDHARKVIRSTRVEDLDNEVDFFGEKTTVRRILILLAVHSHEHLGQTVAYARMNGVVPPWSEGGQ